MNQLSISIDLNDDYAGLTGRFEANQFKGFGEGWFNVTDIIKFCDNLKQLACSLEGKAQLISNQSNSDYSECTEVFGLRCYVLSTTGIIGIHVSLVDYPYTDCRAQELSCVSGELKVERQSVIEFSQALRHLCLGQVTEVILTDKE